MVSISCLFFWVLFDFSLSHWNINENFQIYIKHVFNFRLFFYVLLGSVDKLNWLMELKPKLNELNQTLPLRIELSFLNFDQKKMPSIYLPYDHAH